jgi:hypothetical protein
VTVRPLSPYRQGLLDQIAHLGDTFLAEQVRAELYRAENAEAKLAETEARLRAAVEGA